MWDIAECVEEKSDIKKKTLNGVKIKIIGIGKTGNNVINKMTLNNIVKADFIMIDTEKLNLDSSKAPKKIFVSSITSFEAMEDLRKQTALRKMPLMKLLLTMVQQEMCIQQM